MSLAHTVLDLTRGGTPSRKARRYALAGEAFHRNPGPTFAAMRRDGQVVRTRFPFIGDLWACTTHEACGVMLKDNASFVQEGRNAGGAGVAGLKWWMPATVRLLADNMLMKDEPEHRRLRKLVDHAFARRDILAMRASIEKVADRMIDEFDGEVIDLTANLARRLPAAVICDLLGLPDEDRAAFAAWAERAMTIRSILGLGRALGLIGKMSTYLREQIAERRRRPAPGLIGELVRAEHEGDRLTEDELLAMVFLLLVAGFETTTHLISDSVWALDQHPEQKAWLLADPASRMERGVEELARWCSAVQSTKPRLVARDMDFFGAPLRQGDVIMAFLGSANHDPTVFDNPEALQLDRFPNPHLVFGAGVHFCLGLQLARVEAQSALSRLYARYPDLEVVAPDRADWAPRPGIRGLRSLPVRLGARAA